MRQRMDRDPSTGRARPIVAWIRRLRLGVFTVLITAAGAACISTAARASAGGRAALTDCPITDPKLLEWQIPLNNTGIGDLKFLNPRLPFDWLARVPESQRRPDDPADPGKPPAAVEKEKDEYEASLFKLCLPKIRLAFRNDTSGRSFLIAFPIKVKTQEKMKSELAAALEELRQTLLALEGAPSHDPDLADRLDRALDPPPDWKPCSLDCEACEARDLAKRAEGSQNVLARKQGKRLTALLDGIDLALRTEKLLSNLEQQCKQPDAAGQRACSLQIGVPAGLSQLVDEQQWAAISTATTNVIKFSVSFFDEEGTPSNPTGYLRVGRTWKEEPSKTAWSLTAGVGASYDPLAGRKDAGGKPIPFTADDPYTGAQRRRFPGTGRLSLVQTFNNVAAANVDITFKAGDLGESDTTRDLTVTKYDVSAFGTRGFALRGGKYAMAAPSDGLAINESGEGFELVVSRFNNVSLGHLVKRESLEGTSDDADLDSDVTILQARNLPVGGRGFFTSADYSILYGRENKKDQTPYDYWTIGGEIRFARAEGLEQAYEALAAAKVEGGTADDEASCLRVCRDECPKARRAPSNGTAREHRWPFSGNLALYRSERSARNRPVVSTPPEPGAEPPETKVVPEGSGTVGLVTLKWTRMAIDQGPGTNGRRYTQTKAQRSFRLRLGRGSGDDPATEDDEGYLGETAVFAPDKLFLKAFSRNLDSGGLGQIGPGLSNKAFAELAYTDHTWSIFRRLALFLTKTKPDDIRDKKKADPVVTQATIFKAHYYRFVEEVRGSSDAGFEVGLDFEIQVPKGVKATLGLGRFFPGDALEDLFETNPYVVTLTTSVTLK